MKTATAPLIALLNGANSLNPLCMADLYTFTLWNGTALRWTTFDRALTFGGNTWQIGPAIDRAGIKTVIGTQVDSMHVRIRPTQEDTLAGALLSSFIVAGGLDGAKLQVLRAFMPAPGAPITGTLIQFAGRVAAVSGGRTGFDIEVKSDLELLNMQSPRNYYAPDCSRVLYDAGCAVNKAGVTSTGTVTSAGTATLGTSLTTAAADYYDLGVLTFTSGPNTGLTRSIKKQAAGGAITLVPALPVAAGVGDAFSLYPGCDKTQGAGGCAKFYSTANVLLHHRGFPYVPVPETSLG